MKRRVLGRTGLKVSIMGLGCGGHSRLGQSYGHSATESIEVVRAAVDEGINYFDTAQNYRTESILGKALEGIPRENYVLSTKISSPKVSLLGRLFDKSGDYFEKGLHQSLRDLKTDCIDVLSLHAIPDIRYKRARDRYAEHLIKFKEQGEIRFLGITEAFASDPTHKMLKLAVEDDIWDVIMVGLNFVNQSALRTIFPKAIEKDLGIQIMFAVRRKLASPDRLNELVREMCHSGLIDPQELDSGENLLEFLLRPDVAESLTDAAYRYCAHVPGSQVVLSGTGNPEHLGLNAESLNRPALSNEVLARLGRIFGKITQETCN